MSFLFRRSTEQTREVDVSDREIKSDHESLGKEESPSSINNEKQQQDQNLPVKKKGSFFKSLKGNGYRNGSTTSLNSTSSSGSSFNKLPPLSPLTLVGYKESTRHRLLDLELANNIRNLIPARLQLFDNWNLVYSLEQHGISLNTLYRNCDPEHQLLILKKKRKEQGFADNIVKSMVVGDITGSRYLYEPKRPQSYVVVVKDEHGNKFGAYLNENLKPMEHRRYYGNGECFLWKCELYDPSKLNHAVDKKSKSEVRFKAFMYTGINDNIIYSNHEFISVGSSNGQNGLYIDKSLLKGVSYSCETFGNEVLNSSEHDAKFGSFKIKGLEIWRIGSLE
ncbi:Oxidation resistance protein 1 [Candida viswanathii]|uniref:Oxidation resistance protein 1 n=1 Tax=Candida viswanathii TaxID=5486 RepID=A0A367XY41_9ASCO|nr:Oxidation resistance protein 1 [Candida viswanathii]